jgi:hypothetical protein
MRLRTGVPILFLSLLTLSSAHAQTAKDIVGCWRLQSLVADRGGEKSEPFGPNPIGQYLYTDDGHVSVVQMRPDAPQNASVEPTRLIVTSYIAYFGTYELRGKEIAIKVEGSTRSDWRNTTLTRTIETFTPTKLVFAAHPDKDLPDKDLTVTVTVVRCEPARH